jgi:hypothetical protein
MKRVIGSLLRGLIRISTINKSANLNRIVHSVIKTGLLFVNVLLKSAWIINLASNQNEKKVG